MPEGLEPSRQNSWTMGGVRVPLEPAVLQRGTSTTWRTFPTPLFCRPSFLGYCCIQTPISPTSCSGHWALFSSIGTCHLRWPVCGSVPTWSKIACSVRLWFPVNLGDQLLEAVMTQASEPLHPSVAQCHVTPQLGFLGQTSPLSAGFNFHFLS